jgi:N-acetylmuramoyl-L-alanine amidase
MEKTIILNAGHNNAADCGAAANGTTEAAEVIKIRDKLASLLKQNFEVVLVPDELDLRQSIKWVNDQYKKLEDGLAFSIHLNAGGGTGAEIFYYADNEISQNIAKTIINKYCEITGFRNRGAKADITTRHKRLGWIRDTNTWSCLIEACFIDNIEDLKKLQSNYDKVAFAMYSGICVAYGIESGSFEIKKEPVNMEQIIQPDVEKESIKKQIGQKLSEIEELIKRL